MTEIFARLFPAVRDIRNPLAVGYAWMIVGWVAAKKLAAGRHGSDPVATLVRDVTDGLPDLVIISLLTFFAVMLGSGLVRLMDRVMQAVRKTSKDYNPTDRGRRKMVQCHVTSQSPESRARQEWGGPEDDDSLLEDDLRLYLFYLQQDLAFGALQSEQLLRFSLLPPAITATCLSAIWLLVTPGLGTVLLTSGAALFAVVLLLDYWRTGSLMENRWRSLADEYPTWLPDEVVERRNQRHVRVRAILDSDAGLRSFSGLDSSDAETNRVRIAALRNTAAQLRANGAKELATNLERALPAAPDEPVQPARADAFLELASRWNGVWQTETAAGASEQGRDTE